MIRKTCIWGFIVLLIVLSVHASGLWFGELFIDDVRLWLTPRSEKALKAADFALERVDEIKSLDEAKGIDAAYALQDMLTVIEQNINMPGPPHKVLRAQQDVEERVRLIGEQLAIIETQGEEYALVLKHARLRAELLLEEIELAKQKTRVKIG